MTANRQGGDAEVSTLKLMVGETSSYDFVGKYA